MWLEFYTLPKNGGISCEHCGAYIRNVHVIHFDDGFILKCGSECFTKLLKGSNLSQYGARAFRRAADSLKRYSEIASNWARWTSPEEAEADGCSQRIEDPANPGAWRIRTQEEFAEEKAFVLDVFIPAQVERRQAEMQKRFKGVRFPRPKPEKNI